MKVARCVLRRLRSGNTPWLSDAELQNLYEAANKVCEQKSNGVALTLLRCSTSLKKAVPGIEIQA